jgi:superfamily II DNA helicase RecQ
MALSCVFRAQRASGFNFGASHLIEILRGARTEKVLQRGHDQLSTFGIGAALSEPECARFSGNWSRTAIWPSITASARSC